MRIRSLVRKGLTQAIWIAPAALILLASTSTNANGPWYVSPSGNDDNDCLSPTTPCASINASIAKAESGDEIFISSGSYTGNGDEVVYINKRIDLSGGWSNNFAIQNGKSIIDGEDERRVMEVEFDAGGEMENLTIQNGRGEGAPGIDNEGGLTLRNCTIQNNTDLGDWTSEGGGIRNATGLFLYNTTVSDNSSSSGAGIFNAWGYVYINNSTISGNVASGHGGGINNLGGDLEIYNSTITNNSDSSGAGGIHNESRGEVTLKNTILAKNSGSYGIDCNGSIGSLGYNLIGSVDNCTFSPAIGDLIGASSWLGNLQDNGGFTYTHALNVGSKAINQGDPAGCKDHSGSLLDEDQRGFPRYGRCDIGAYEFQNDVLSLYLPLVAN